jgi:hypothetical protein
MAMNRNLVIAAVLLIVATAAGGQAETASPGTPLPDFQVTGVDDVRVRSATLRQDGNWLLIYVWTQCAECDELLDLFSKAEVPPPFKRIVLIVGGASAAQARRRAAGHPTLADAHWYADASNEAFEKLGLSGVPYVIGLTGTSVRWTLGGASSSDAGEARAILATWIGR